MLNEYFRALTRELLALQQHKQSGSSQESANALLISSLAKMIGSFVNEAMINRSRGPFKALSGLAVVAAEDQANAVLRFRLTDTETSALAETKLAILKTSLLLLTAAIVDEKKAIVTAQNKHERQQRQLKCCQLSTQWMTVMAQVFAAPAFVDEPMIALAILKKQHFHVYRAMAECYQSLYRECHSAKQRSHFLGLAIIYHEQALECHRKYQLNEDRAATLQENLRLLLAAEVLDTQLQRTGERLSGKVRTSASSATVAGEKRIATVLASANHAQSSDVNTDENIDWQAGIDSQMQGLYDEAMSAVRESERLSAAEKAQDEVESEFAAAKQRQKRQAVSGAALIVRQQQQYKRQNRADSRCEPTQNNTDQSRPEQMSMAFLLN